jgi:hypothetical protein
MESIESALSTSEMEGVMIKERSAGSFDSSDSGASNTSANSKDSVPPTRNLPTFTNEVVVIRPEQFYENEDCQKDNKFMKNSGL